MTTLLLTGATGAVGQPLLAALLRSRRFGRVIVPVRGDAARRARQMRGALAAEEVDTGPLVTVAADLADPAADLASWPAADVVVHAAACTRFRAPAAELAAINVGATARLLAWAGALPRRPRFVHLSTLCVAGCRTGVVPEEPLRPAPAFINAYEHSKWEAEQLVFGSDLRPEIVRLGIVAGRESDGRIPRPGALHAALRWMRRGLLPLVPGEPATGVDLISTDLVARFVDRLLAVAPEPHRLCHLTAGPARLSIAELIALGAGVFAAADPAWRTRQILPPVVAPRTAFAAFRRSIEQSRDLLFNQVLASADAFLPMLLHPKVFATGRAESAWGGPLPWPEPRTFAARVLGASLDAADGRAGSAEEAA
ncbi:MAG TPA: SDR family oxidoreductase [Opitutaceae bacterium]|nr:SDR family oxidoreductase [Opitutaceae bacterium]